MSRTRILEGAALILDSGAYSDLTVDALARSLRMSKSTLYKYFNSKDAVVVSLVEQACAETDEALERRTRTGDPEDRMRALVTVVGEHGDRLPRAVILEGQSLPDACRSRVEKTRKNLKDSCQTTVARGAQQGVFDVPDPTLAATAFMAGAEAAIGAAARGEVERSRSEAVEALWQLFVPGLMPQVAVAK